MIMDVISSRRVKDFYNNLQTALKRSDVEKSIERAYVDVLYDYFKNAKSGSEVVLTYPHGSDGLIEVGSDLFDDSFSILVEAKRGLNFSDNKNKDAAKVIAQVLFYLKKFELAGEVLPAVAVIGDEDEVFALPTKFLYSYLSEDWDWSVSPSSAGKITDLVEKIKADKNLRPHVENVLDEGFNIEEFINRVNDFGSDKDVRKIRVDSETLAKAFLEFQRVVFGGQTVDTQTQMMIFVKSLLGDETIWLHPRRKNTIVIEYLDHKGNIKIKLFPPSDSMVFDAEAYDRFWSKYDRGDYSLTERKAITEIGDTLFEDFERRFHGDFWTPKIWVDEAHRLIERQLNTYKVDADGNLLDLNGDLCSVSGLPPVLLEDWKDKYVVWDPAAGSLNLTRDYKFKELYASTLHQDELNIAENYNPEATKFQYDFLNDDIDLHSLNADGGSSLFSAEDLGREWKLPDGLINALKNNKPIVFFANPPYGQATKQDGDTKGGIATTEIQTKMVKEKFGIASAELYTQFIYRVQLFAKLFGYTNDFHFFFFNKGFLTSQSFRNFTKALTSQFEFKDGFMLNAGEFNGTSSAWGIIFAHWQLRDPAIKDFIPQTTFDFMVKESAVKGNEEAIVDLVGWTGKTTVSTISQLIPKTNHANNLPKGSYPTTANGFNASRGKTSRGTMVNGAFGYFHNNGDNIQFSDKHTGLYSLCFNAGNGTPITPDNFKQSAVVFSVRKSVLNQVGEANLLWVRDKDIFTKPTETFINSDKWDGFVADSVVYSLFSKGSNQTALRDYVYGENEDGTPKKWRVNNEFFWLPKSKIKELAIEDKVWDIENDLATDIDRYVYNWLKDHEDDLSQEALNILEISERLVEATMKYRVEYNEIQPKFNLLSWDAGFLQLYKMSSPRSREGLVAAKTDPVVIKIWEELEAARKVLGDKIADLYKEDTGF